MGAVMTKSPATSSDKNEKSKSLKKLTQRIQENLKSLTASLMPPNLNLRSLGNILLWVVASLLIGWLLGYAFIQQPAVGIIRLNTDIWTDDEDIDSVDLILAQIDAARQDATIRAVVIQIDSPGGEVAATQTLYLELQNLRREMPVVCSIEGIAASGGYYVALATDPIYANPSSTVGNIGVWGFTPPDLGVSEMILTSGPFKLTASNRQEFIRAIEEIKQEFLETIVSQRGERLDISQAELSQGLAYTGREALQLGLIDHLGSQSYAIANAAKLAHIAHYNIIDLYQRVMNEIMEREADLGTWIAAADPVTGKRMLPPGAYLLYDLRLGGMP